MRMRLVAVCVSAYGPSLSHDVSSQSSAAEMLKSYHFVYGSLQVFAVDWSPDGQKVASGGRDKVLKLWMS